MKRAISILSAILLLGIPVLASAATWQLDPDHSSIQFKIRHLTVSNVKGDFSKLIKGLILYDGQDVSGMKAEVTLDASSVNTGHAKRDEHLKGPDFFDVSRFPTINFVSKQVTKIGPDRLRATGDLTLHGVTREIVFEVQGPTSEVKDPWGNFRRGLTATSKINRKDFGITWNKTLDTGGLVVGEEVEIYVEVEMIKK